MDYYQILKVGRTARPEEIKSAYRKLSRKYHPDNAGEQAKEQFEKVQEAYAVLGDEKKRAAYDGKLEEQAAGGQQRGSGQQPANQRQEHKNENNYKDLAAFYSGAYKNSFEKFFGLGSDGKAKKDTGAKPVNTDKLFEAFFGIK